MDLLGFLPSFGNFALTIAAFVAALSIIVAIHEYGHYIVGRWTGIHAEVFSLGFGPVLWSRHDRRGTKWQISAIPLGGYVKFMGDANAASGKDGEMISSLSDEELRHTMHGAPLWARFATVLAGPMFNFISAIIIFTGLAISIGVPAYPPVIADIYPLPANDFGLQSGDKILAINGVIYPENRDDFTFDESLRKLPALDYTVRRDGIELIVSGPPLIPARVSSVTPGWAADVAGIREGDVVLSIGSHDVFAFDEMIPLMNDSKGVPTLIKLWRDGAEYEVTIEAQKRDIPKADNSFDTRYIMGVSGSYFYTPAYTSIGFVEAVKSGGQQTWRRITQSISGLYHMAIGKISSCNISGPVGIAKISKHMASQGTESFIYFIAVLSAAVGMLNLFPIPVLDGGHLVFYTWEAITGSPPNDKALQILMTGGLALILSFMLFALSNDFLCP